MTYLTVMIIAIWILSTIAACVTMTPSIFVAAVAGTTILIVGACNGFEVK